MSGLVVNVGPMGQNLKSTKGLIVGEAVMMELAKHTGRQKAHDIVYEACKETIESGLDLLTVLLRKDEVTAVIPEHDLSSLCEPANYLGAASRMVDDVVAMTDESLVG
jgi:adenylosuccinate lyase